MLKEAVKTWLSLSTVGKNYNTAQVECAGGGRGNAWRQICTSGGLPPGWCPPALRGNALLKDLLKNST